MRGVFSVLRISVCVCISARGKPFVNVPDDGYKSIKQYFAFYFFLQFCNFPPLHTSRSHPLHQWHEREHSPSGGHAIWTDGQLQLGGGLQSPYHHPPPHDVRQRGRRLAHKKHTHTNKQTDPPSQSSEAAWKNCIISQTCLSHKLLNAYLLIWMIYSCPYQDYIQGCILDTKGVGSHWECTQQILA